jgi:hypothetical protein
LSAIIRWRVWLAVFSFILWCKHKLYCWVEGNLMKILCPLVESSAQSSPLCWGVVTILHAYAKNRDLRTHCNKLFFTLTEHRPLHSWIWVVIRTHFAWTHLSVANHSIIMAHTSAQKLMSYFMTAFC